jgi:hypothetical protein
MMLIRVAETALASNEHPHRVLDEGLEGGQQGGAGRTIHHAMVTG